MSRRVANWFELQAPLVKGVGVAKRVRTFAIADDGEIYCAPDMFGDRTAVFLCACADGVKIALGLRKNEMYYPLSWLRAEWPQHEAVAVAIEGIANECRELPDMD